MSIAKIQSGDQVKIISGNYKGTVGQVTRIVKKKSPTGVLKVRAAVSTVPKITKYRRAMKSAGYPGQMFMVDRLIDTSNLSLVTSNNQISKVKIVVNEDGKKTRILKKDNSTVTKQPVVKSLDESKTENN